MTCVAVLGAGSGGVTAVVDLILNGHEVRLWNRSRTTLVPYEESGGVRYFGVLGEGLVQPEIITTDLSEALQGADLAIVCLPATAHPSLFRALAKSGLEVPLVLNPGGVGGALEARATLNSSLAKVPPIAELSTLTYIARKREPDAVTIIGLAQHVWGASLPGGEQALDAARELYPIISTAPDVLFSGLCNVNLVLHPPGALLGAAWIEATQGSFNFYVEGMTPGVARVLDRLDEERQMVGRAFGHELPTLLEEMMAIGTADPSAAAQGNTMDAVRGGSANAEIRAPDSLAHRYYWEDFAFGLLPFREFARLGEVSVPVANSLWTLGTALVGENMAAKGRNAQSMGIGTLAELTETIRGDSG